VHLLHRLKNFECELFFFANLTGIKDLVEDGNRGLFGLSPFRTIDLSQQNQERTKTKSA
jgi:hypothetical protein